MRKMNAVNENSDLIQFLKDRYTDARSKNTSYSLTAYARDLGVSQPFLSRLLNKERLPTVRVAAQIAAACSVNQRIADRWISKIVLGSKKSAKITNQLRSQYEKKAKDHTAAMPVHYEIEKFRMISQWYHLAILYLTYVKDFKNDPRWIAKRLDITPIEVTQAMERMFTLGVLKQKGNRLIVTNDLISVEAKKSETAIREFHKQMGEKALDALKDGSKEFFDRRMFSSVTFAVNPNRLPEFKEKIKGFQNEVLGMLKSDQYSEVYHLNLQLFPLTKVEEREK